MGIYPLFATRNLVWHWPTSCILVGITPFQHCSNTFKLNKHAKVAFSAIASRFPQLLERDTDMVASYCVELYLQHCYALLVTSNPVHNYCKVLHKGCNTDVLGVLLIYLYSPSSAVHPWDHACISVKPLSCHVTTY